MKKRKNIIAVCIAVLVLLVVILLLLRGCSNVAPEIEESKTTLETTEESTEATEIETTEDSTEESPLETTEESTEVATETPTEEEMDAPTEDATEAPTAPLVTESIATEPIVTEPPATEPLITEPQPTEPPVTEPTTTEPQTTECSHVWQEIYHEEVSHKQKWFTCVCGERFSTEDEWFNHAVSSENTFTEHPSWHKEYDVIVDTPAYSTWVCANCGETRDTQP